MAINTKTYISKCNTIIKGSYANTGLNPIMELNYGLMNTRGILYFDHTKVKKMVEDKIYPDISKLKHVLKMTNTASVNEDFINCGMLDSEYNNFKQRAISFDLIFFLIPNEWDMGRGFDYVKDLYFTKNRGLSIDGSNWYKYKNYCTWSEEGIYTTDHLSLELDNFTSLNGNQSNIIIGYQHFDKGNEPLELDITETFNKFITGELCNYGVGIAFSPIFEDTQLEESQYVGFFTQHTNSYFEPYVETTYNDYVEDDRLNFCLDKVNRLYFYSIINGNRVNLDEMPTAEIDGREYEVKQTTKGAYYIEVDFSSEQYEPDTMYYDIWKNIKYNGKQIKDVELEFVTKESTEYYNFGIPQETITDFVPSLYGINHLEKIRRGDIRRVNIDCRIPYTSNQSADSVGTIEYRLYTMDGTREIDVIAYDKVEKAYDKYYFLINTNDLIPSRYYIDIKITYGMEEKYHRDKLEFDIVNDVTQVYN